MSNIKTTEIWLETVDQIHVYRDRDNLVVIRADENHGWMGYHEVMPSLDEMLMMSAIYAKGVSTGLSMA